MLTKVTVRRIPGILSTLFVRSDCVELAITVIPLVQKVCPRRLLFRAARFLNVSLAFREAVGYNARSKGFTACDVRMLIICMLLTNPHIHCMYIHLEWSGSAKANAFLYLVIDWHIHFHAARSYDIETSCTAEGSSRADTFCLSLFAWSCSWFVCLRWKKNDFFVFVIPVLPLPYRCVQGWRPSVHTDH